MLEAELELRDKLPVTWALRTAIEEAPRGQVPDLEAVFDERGADTDADLAAARDGLIDTVTDTITRSFRPGVLRRRRRSPRRPRSPRSSSASAGERTGATRPARTIGAAIGVAAVAVVGVGLIAAEIADGAADVGEYEAADPCTAPPDTYPGDGLDAIAQRIGLSALNGAACELGTSREKLVLSLDPDSGYDDVTWDDDDRRGGAAVRRAPGHRRRRRARLDPRVGRVGHALRRRPGARRLARRAPADPRLNGRRALGLRAEPKIG